MAQLSAEQLTKSYGKRTVVNRVSIQVDQGQIVSLLGPNGAGKTTTFYMVSGLVKPDSGSITLDGHDITANPIHQRAQQGIGYLPQEASIFRQLSVYQNLIAALEVKYPKDPEQRQPIAERLLDEFSLQHVRNSKGAQLSGGERRRAEIARALATRPRFILLDEPFAGVDPISVHDTKTLIRQVADRNIGVIITDHNVRETLSICDFAYILAKGEIIASGDPHTIVNNESVKAAYLGSDFKLG